MSDLEQLVRASRLYYELGETQNAIAEQLGVTRPQVSRLLKRARAEGIVEIRIVDRTSVESPAADMLRRTYGLDAVHLAPTIAMSAAAIQSPETKWASPSTITTVQTTAPAARI